MKKLQASKAGPAVRKFADEGGSPPPEAVEALKQFMKQFGELEIVNSGWHDDYAVRWMGREEPYEQSSWSALEGPAQEEDDMGAPGGPSYEPDGQVSAQELAVGVFQFWPGRITWDQIVNMARSGEQYAFEII